MGRRQQPVAGDRPDEGDGVKKFSHRRTGLNQDGDVLIAKARGRRTTDEEYVETAIYSYG